MSNQAYIQQEAIVIRHTGEHRKMVAVFDNYANEHLDMIVCNEEGEFIDDNTELLRAVVRLGKDSEYSTVGAILEHVAERHNGITIEGTYFPWEQVERILREEGFGA